MNEQSVLEAVKAAMQQARKDGKIPPKSDSRPYLRSNTVTNYANVGYDESEGGRMSINLSETAVPSKAVVKRMAGRPRSDRVFRTTGVGSSRSAMIDMLKAIAHPETGCIVAEHEIPNRPMQATTSSGIGNVLGGRQIIDLNPKSGRTR